MARMKDKKNAKRSKMLRIPGMKGVEGKRATLPPGRYTAKVTSVEIKEGQKDDYIAWELAVVGGDHDGAKLYYNTSLSPGALWNARGLFEAMGVDCEDDDFEVDPDELVGQEIGVEVEHELYEGRKRARVTDYFPADEDGDEDQEEKKSKRSRDDDEDEDDDKKKSKRNRRASREEAEDEDDDEDDKKSSKKKSDKKKASLTGDAIDEMDQGELEDLIAEHELDVDLGDHRTLTKMRRAVKKAAQEAGALDD